MQRVPYTAFGKTKLVPLITYTNGKRDIPDREDFKSTLWIERGEDWYGLSHYVSPVLIVNRHDFLRAPQPGKETDK